MEMTTGYDTDEMIKNQVKTSERRTELCSIILCGKGTGAL
jgi:hypothetical protein